VLTIEADAAHLILDLVAAEGAAPEGGLRIQALASAEPGRPEVTTSVSPAATETDTVFVDEASGARVFVDQATADVVDGRILARAPDEREAGGFVVR
jgi:Fe-S cluster assembly iron-binding protein IscA